MRLKISRSPVRSWVSAVSLLHQQLQDASATTRTDHREGPVAFLRRVCVSLRLRCLFHLGFRSIVDSDNAAACTLEGTPHTTARGRTRTYTWPGSNWRPSACWADVIATRPQVHIVVCTPLFRVRCVQPLPLCQRSRSSTASFVQTKHHRTCGLVAMTSASHAEGRQFDPGQV